MNKIWFAVLEVANELHKPYYANVWIKHKQCVVGILTLHLDSFANDFEQLGHNITAGSNARI